MASRVSTRAHQRFRDARDKADGWVAGYTGGLSTRELARLFERDANKAYSVLTRGQETTEPDDQLSRFLYRARVILFGFTAHLGPSRRLLFAGSMLAAMLGLLDSVFEIAGPYSVELSPLWFSASIVGLLFLLALEIVDQVRVRDELEVARALQNDLLPDRAPELEGYSFSHSYRTANEVGGDSYDFCELPDGRLALMVGDASGHGIAAGLLMAIANATVKLAIELDPAPDHVVDLLNRALLRTGDRRAFMTFFYALLDPATGRLEFVCAGHPFPLLRRRGGALEELGRGSLPLGLREELTCECETVELAAGDLLVLYSDGLPEATDADDHAFGFDRLRELVSGAGTPRRLRLRVLEALDRHLGRTELQDDFSLVVLGRDAELPPLPVN